MLGMEMMLKNMLGIDPDELRAKFEEYAAMIGPLSQDAQLFITQMRQVMQFVSVTQQHQINLLKAIAAKLEVDDSGISTSQMIEDKSDATRPN